METLLAPLVVSHLQLLNGPSFSTTRHNVKTNTKYSANVLCSTMGIYYDQFEVTIAWFT